MSATSMHSLLILSIGFAVAGLLATAFQLLAARPLSFRLLHEGPSPSLFAALACLMFAAPFVIMRNTVRGQRIERRPFAMVMLATVLAGFWSLMSGTVVIGALGAVGLIAT